MRIRKKLSLFVVALIITPMALLLVASTYVFQSQIEKTQQSYLSVAMKLIRNQMHGRKMEMQKICRFLSDSTRFQTAFQEQNHKVLQAELQTLHRNYGYINFSVIVDRSGQVLAQSPPSLMLEKNDTMKSLVQNALQTGFPNISEEVFELGELFKEDSAEYGKYLIQRHDQTPSGDSYLSKCLSGLVIVPLPNPDIPSSTMGAIIVGGIANNDDDFPQYYSENIKDSYLSLSIDGIRISSNIKSAERQSFIGSTAPDKRNYPLAYNGLQYFGKTQVDKETHVFLDEEILNSAGQVVAILGVGIPEEKFSEIVADNYKIVTLTACFCLIVMLFIGRLVANRISRPIIAATNLARNYCERDTRGGAITGTDTDDEGEVLLHTFSQFTNNLLEKETERKIYLTQLNIEHDKQKELAAELTALNDKLERAVDDRTQHLQEAISQMQKLDIAKSQFIANISHELRTPLNAIIGSAEVLIDHIFGDLNEKQQKYISNIHSSGKHLLQLINDILDISKIAAGKMNLQLVDFFVEELIRQVVDNLKNFDKGKQLSITVTLQPSDFRVNADPHKIKQILYNLLSNAMKFTENSGEISILGYQREHFMEIIIKDTGIGIADANLERVFLEFEQIDNSYSKQYPGTGLGLPLVKKLVEMHGGQVFLNSKLGVGTEVIFTIPLHTENFLDNNYNKTQR